MWEYLISVLYGILEGITEWLPVSSTGHLIILENFLKMDISPDFFRIFLVMIQLGAIFAVLYLYFDDINPFRFQEGKLVIPDAQKNLWKKVIVACIPAALVGILFDDLSEALFYNYFSVGIALIVFGVVFLLAEKPRRRLLSTDGSAHAMERVDGIENITWKQVAAVGMFQVIAAIFPGTSRSGATITGGMLAGISRKTSADFTFILAIPVMLGAGILRLVKYGVHHSAYEWSLLFLGMLTAFSVSVVTIRYLLSYLKNNSLKVFAYYRFVLGGLLILYGVLN